MCFLDSGEPVGEINKDAVSLILDALLRPLDVNRPSSELRPYLADGPAPRDLFYPLASTTYTTTTKERQSLIPDSSSLDSSVELSKQEDGDSTVFTPAELDALKSFGRDKVNPLRLYTPKMPHP
ncbi:unnamed protein product, partial [Protopolystoma xenopodis]